MEELAFRGTFSGARVKPEQLGPILKGLEYRFLRMELPETWILVATAFDTEDAEIHLFCGSKAREAAEIVHDHLQYSLDPGPHSSHVTVTAISETGDFSGRTAALVQQAAAKGYKYEASFVYNNGAIIPRA